MREIKFRAINRKTGRLEPLIWNFLDNLSGGPQIYKGGTIQQYTGLKDKNGVEIYEGDIYRTYGEYRGKLSVLGNGKKGSEYQEGRHVVEWNEDNCGFNIYKPTYGNQYEVIGNIYENEDLIK